MCAPCVRENLVQGKNLVGTNIMAVGSAHYQTLNMDLHFYKTRISGRYAALILGPAGGWHTLLKFVSPYTIFLFPHV